MLDSTNCTGPGEKDPWHCFGQVVGRGQRGAGVGDVFIYNLGFVCTAYCIML